MLSLFLLLTFLPWTHQKEKSKGYTCPPLTYSRLDNGTIRALSRHRYHFQCHKGFFLAGDSLIRCWKGKWSSSKQPMCIKSEGQCDDPPQIPNGDLFGDEKTIGSIIQYMCHSGYVLLGEGTRTCLDRGHWSGITPACMDESEPLQTVAQRLNSQFVTKLGTYSSDNIAQGRLLDSNSLLRGLEIVILLDRSSSVDPVDLEIGKEFIKFLLREFNIKNGDNKSGARAAVLVFGSTVDIIFNVNNVSIHNLEAANNAIDTIKPGGGGTAMEPALTEVLISVRDFLRPNAKRALFLISDGDPNIGNPEITPENMAEILKTPVTGKFEIFTVGVGKDINRQLLARIASKPLLSHVFMLNKFSDLQEIMEIIKDKPTEIPPVSPEKCGYLDEKDESTRKWQSLAAIYIGFPEHQNESEKNETEVENKAAGLSFCSGTLICSQWVITAASCFHKVNNRSIQLSLEEVFITLGENDLEQKEKEELNFYASDVIIHPSFNPLENLRHNLALIKLNTPVPVGTFRPACLPPTDKPIPLHLNLNSNTSFAGWGLPQDNTDSNEISEGVIQLKLTQAPVILSTEATCEEYAGRAAQESIFCAGFPMYTCIGDMGSPIMAVDSRTDTYHIIGVLSRKTSCNSDQNQYIELTNYLRWINDATKRCHIKHWMM